MIISDYQQSITDHRIVECKNLDSYSREHDIIYMKSKCLAMQLNCSDGISFINLSFQKSGEKWLFVVVAWERHSARSSPTPELMLATDNSNRQHNTDLSHVALAW